MTLSRANLLILDEPTNHLDVENIEALEDALEEFDGSVLLVSHDRAFLREVVLLLTDGLPNCNPSNPNGGKAVECRCTQSPCPTSYPALLCLDKDASVAAVDNLFSQKKIRTIVIGFGADFTSTDPEKQAGAETLNAMAVAGNFPRTVSCAANASICGAGDTCNATTKVCDRRFYLAANQVELANALAEILNRVGSKDVCLLPLDPAQRPSDPKLIVVYLGEKGENPLPVLPELTSTGDRNWELTDKGVQFLGPACARIQGSTVARPITVEVRAVQRK
jgi:hypothetical protein